MNRYVDVFYDRYLSDNRTITIGGVQTYITDLYKILREMGMEVRIVQFARENYVHQLDKGVCVAGFQIERGKDAQRYQQLYDAAVKNRKETDVLSIFATDTIIPRKVSGSCIAIQHGIFWDIPRDKRRTLIRQVVSRAVAAYRTVERLNRMNSVVCVDYNFLNWYRTQVNRIPGNTSVIPNYTRIAPETVKQNGTVNIIFARRLFAYRGTRVFTNALMKLLDEGAGIAVTIAGAGEDEQWMHERLDMYQNVRFMTYESHESLDIHKDQHIAVVPTVGSEGTSLSLLEAMSAQCAVICTNVGGMTNIVIDGFNGLMVDAGSEEQLYRAIRVLVEDTSLRQRLAKNGYETVKQAFTFEKWCEDWKSVIREVQV